MFYNRYICSYSNIGEMDIEDTRHAIRSGAKKVKDSFLDKLLKMLDKWTKPTHRR
jgi:hypothetical protein